jgi:hypothetical protein
MLHSSLTMVLFLASVLRGIYSSPPLAQEQDASRTFPETGHTVQGRFLDYWQQHGGLTQNGYPLSEELQEVSPLDGQTYTVQYFERAVFEYHPKNQPPYDVLLSQLGTIRYQYRYPTGAPNQRASTQNPRRFAETGHTLGGRFRTYWEEHGGLAQQGYPISDEFAETSEIDGKSYTVQYFERAVLEYHPENKLPYDVLVSQLGRFRLLIRQAKQAAAALPSPPRIYAPKGQATELWPDSTGSTVTTFSTCGAQPLEGLGNDLCDQPMTLTTQLTPDGPAWRVTFGASWANGAQQHHWVLRVAGDGKATLLQETGDRLPILPQ